MHSDFGYIPKEVISMLSVKHDHLGKFIDFFDEREFYVIVTALHGISVSALIANCKP